jgi:hypothetical protein
MKKMFFLAALATLALASCTSDEFIGETSQNTLQKTEGAINFGSGYNAVTRADITGSTAAGMLGNAMKVYGVKQNRTTNTNYDKVFVDYSVKYDVLNEKVGNDEYNEGWYYVGAETNQVIKYWDWASADYHFVAGSPVANFTYALDGTTGDIKTATVTGLGGHLNHTTKNASATPAAVYIADPKVVAKANYNQEVQFTFRSMQTKVRVGIYETIPGYKITSIQFYNNESTPVASNYITLNGATTGYFQGGTSVTGTVTYNWTTPAYTFAYSSGLTPGNYWEGGQFTAGVPAINSASTDLYGVESDMASNGYFIVMPTPSATAAQPLTLTCDYTLTSLDGSGETIEVKEAKATIPSDYTKWAANTAYTYLFKISDNTNGSTGTPGTDPEGLYPITFDAVVVNVADAGQNVGTETTVSTPSITVYQAGDVVENGITYNAGSVTVHAFEGTTDVTSSATWSYVELGSYTYGTDYEKLGASGAPTTWTPGALTTVAASKTYIIKAVTTNGTAYFVLVVGAAENGPANTNS